MILIWTGDAPSPLHAVFMIVMILKYFAPQLLQAYIGMQNIVDGRSLEERLPSPDQFTLAVVMSIGFVITSVWVLWDSFFPSQAQDNNSTGTANENNNNNNNSEQTAAGTRDDPVIINDDDEYESVLIHLWNRVLAVLRNPSPIHLVLALGFIVPLTILAPLLLDGFQDEYGLTGVVHRQFGTPGVLQMAVLAIVAHSLMALAAYRVLRNLIDGNVTDYPGLRRRRTKLTVTQIADIVYKVPVEEFVSPEDINNGECSIARMKRMLVNRGESSVAESCIEREELVKEICKVRNYNEECAICAEEYQEGDIMRVTHCKHEFHLHCFDKWIYTFATDSRRGYPTCPLCKDTIK